MYKASRTEAWSAVVANLAHGLVRFAKLSCMVIVPFLYFRNGIFLLGDHLVWLKCFTTCSVVYASARLLTATARLQSKEYREFIKLHHAAHQAPGDRQLSKRLCEYSFSSPWPADYDVRSSFAGNLEPAKRNTEGRSTFLTCAFWPFTWILANTIGIFLAYPGCTSIFNYLTLHPRIDARDRLRRQFGVQRLGLSTRDADFVEAFYADRRGTSGSGHGDSNGDILIICCEGNAGYPEIGTCNTPLEQGYSVIAWNHPGFASSSGLPFPAKEENAVEACILYAVDKLKFNYNQIYLFGWSIGGYSVTWAAMNFPQIAGVILDATFDNLDQLCARALPDMLYPLVLACSLNHLDLNNIGQLVSYDGPVRLIRRQDDEIINLSQPPKRTTNCGNFLLHDLLKFRFPHLFTDDIDARFWEFTSLDEAQQTDFYEALSCLDDQYRDLIVEHLRAEAVAKRAAKNGSNSSCEGCNRIRLYPSSLGEKIDDENVKRKLLFFIISQYFQDFPGGHCTPLGTSHFALPWNPLH